MTKARKNNIKLSLSAIILILVISEAIYLMRPHKVGEPTDIQTQTGHTTSTINIVVPQDFATYKKQMTEFAQVGGRDPLKTTKFITKTIIIPRTNDPYKASVEAVTRGISLGGGPSVTLVNYLKIQNGTAYILLNIDQDGWAGVSVVIAIVHPLVEKTLLQFPEIKKVVFGYAPGDHQ